MARVPNNRLRHRVDLPTETKPGEDGRIAGGDGPDLVLGTDTENRKALWAGRVPGPAPS